MELPLHVPVGIALGIPVQDAKGRVIGCIATRYQGRIDATALEVGEVLWGECHQP